MSIDKDNLKGVLSYTDSAGVLWAYDLATSKWSANVNGKKMSSGDIEQLKKKVEAVVKPVQNKKEKQEPVETCLLSLQFNGDKVNVTPLIVKMEWIDGAPRVVRYKGINDSSWSSSQSKTLILADPLAEDTGGLSQMLQKIRTLKVLSETYTASTLKIRDLWWNSKEDRSQPWKEGPGGTLVHASENYDGNMYKTWSTSKDWKHVEPVSFDEFVSDDGGSLIHKASGVLLKFMMHQNYPLFVVMDADGNKLSESRSIEKVIPLACLSANISFDEEAVQSWVTSRLNIKQGGWPVLNKCFGYGLVKILDDWRTATELFVLSQDMESDSLSFNKNLENLKWDAKTKASLSICPVGPEDEVLKFSKAIKDCYMKVTEQTEDLNTFNRFEYQKKLEEKARSLFSDTVLNVYSSSLDEGAQDNSEKVIHAFATMEQRIIARVEKLDEVVEFKEVCKQEVENAENFMANLPLNPIKTRKLKA